jgi:hypothetical protein
VPATAAERRPRIGWTLVGWIRGTAPALKTPELLLIELPGHVGLVSDGVDAPDGIAVPR